MFFWEGLAHDLLPIGKSGLKALSNEQVITALKGNVKEAELYMFPRVEPAPGMTKEQKQELMRKSQEQWYAGPSGLMVIHPVARDRVSQVSLRRSSPPISCSCC